MCSSQALRWFWVFFFFILTLLSKIRHVTSSNCKRPHAHSHVTAANAVKDLHRKTATVLTRRGKSHYSDTVFNNYHPKLEIFFLDSCGWAQDLSEEWLMSVFTCSKWYDSQTEGWSRCISYLSWCPLPLDGTKLWRKRALSVKCSLVGVSEVSMQIIYHTYMI